MRGVSVWIPAFVAASLAFCGFDPAFAEVDPEEEPLVKEDAELLAKEEADVARFLFFTGADIWRNGYFSHGGFLFAPQGLNEEGFVVKLLLNGGLYRFRSGARQITGMQAMAAILPGWRFRGDGLEVTVFAGLDVQDHRFTPDDPNRLRGTHVGLRGGFDVWYEPFRDAMLTASMSLSTAGKSHWTRAAAGWRFFDAIWVGPEFHYCGDDVYRQMRFGAHITSVRAWGYEFSAGAGWVTDTDRRDGVYGRIGMLLRR